MYNIIEGA